jgi:hypothetical protein
VVEHPVLEEAVARVLAIDEAADALEELGFAGAQVRGRDG